MRIAGLVVLSLVLSPVVFGNALLKGTITDATGAGISAATILFHWDSAGSTVGLTSNVGIKQDLIIKADDKGTFAVDLPPGFYDVFVSAMAFTPVCRKIRIGRTPTQELTLLMNVDPLVAEELGTRVEPTLRRR